MSLFDEVAAAPRKPVNILDDLFSNPESRGVDPRYQPVEEVSEGPPMLSSAEMMAEVFRTVVAIQMPPAADIERMRDEGFHLDEKGQKQRGYRWRVERGSMPLEGFIGKQLQNQWAVSVAMLIDRSTLGTFHHALRHEQANGDWVPVQVDARLAPPERRIVTKNATRASRLQPPDTADKVTWLPEMDPILDHVPVAVETFEYAIVWMDRNNAPNMPKLGADGRPIGGQEVNVRVEAAGGSDPAMAAALNRQGDAMQALAEGVRAMADRPVVVSVAAPAPAASTEPPKRNRGGRPPGPQGPRGAALPKPEGPTK